MMNFSEFVTFCETIAEQYQTKIEKSIYQKYGWAQVSFMTDSFGGTYACFHFDLNTGTISNQFNQSETFNIDEINGVVEKNLAEELEGRDLDSIYNLINQEY